jgi:hypothetical protein
MMDQGQKITYHRLGIFLILALLTLACSLSVPGNTKEASPVGIPPVTDTASTAPENQPNTFRILRSAASGTCSTSADAGPDREEFLC